MEKPSSASAVAPQLLRNLIIGAVVFTDKTLLHLPGKWFLLEKLRLLLVTCFSFFLRSFPSVVYFTNPNSNNDPAKAFKFAAKKNKSCDLAPAGSGGGGEESELVRGIEQLLSAMNDIPVNSRKYEVVRSLAEKLINENRGENSAALIDVNRRVLAASFGRTLCRLESAIERIRGEPVRYGLRRAMKAAVKAVGEGLTGWTGEETLDQSAETAEKLAAELLWLSEKMSACGFADEAVEKWASASSLSWLALWAEPQLQGALVQISAFLFNQIKGMGREESEKERWRQTKKKMLMSWVPLLCRASNGSDRPILTSNERAKLQKILEDTIGELKREEQEHVLSLWLHHFTHCSSSDWPNLQASYARWCTSSRHLLIFKSK